MHFVKSEIKQFWQNVRKENLAGFQQKQAPSLNARQEKKKKK